MKGLEERSQKVAKQKDELELLTRGTAAWQKAEMAIRMEAFAIKLEEERINKDADEKVWRAYRDIYGDINNAIADVLKPDPCCRLNQELLPVSRFTMTPLVVVVHPSLQVSSLVDFIQLVKQKRGSVTYASHGPGSISQLVGEWIKSETGTEMVEVPYKAVNAELTDLMGGQVMAAFPVPQVVAGAVKSGKLRALAVLGPARINVLPEVPTVKEAGLPGIEALAWNGIFVPAGTPQPVIERLHRELVRAYNAPDVRGQVTATGSYVAADTPQEFAAFIRAENEKWGKVIREAKIKAE